MCRYGRLVAVNSRASRREQRRSKVVAAFGSKADAALDVLELTEFAWHDCYGEVSPPESVVDDILTVSGVAWTGSSMRRGSRLRTPATYGCRPRPSADKCRYRGQAGSRR
jgi:hypothetical protein